jgi:serine/threonine-protein kinase mTOR
VAERCIESALVALMNSLRMTGEEDYYLQGYLKLLSLLCNHSRIRRVYDLFMENHRRIPVEGWINVVPQMIAQLYQPNEESNFIRILKLLLKTIGTNHPESVLYSLNFAAKSKIAARTRPAGEIIAHIKEHHLELASEVERISSELGRAAIKLKEFWYDGIESAWASYNQNKSAAQIVHQLKELCETVLGRCESNSEIAFHQEFGQEIREGHNWLLRFE